MIRKPAGRPVAIPAVGRSIGIDRPSRSRKICNVKASIGIIILATMLVDAVPAFGQYASVVQATSGLLGYWRFDAASQANSLVNGYTGSLVGGAQIGASGTGPTLAVDPGNTPLVPTAAPAM